MSYANGLEPFMKTCVHAFVETVDAKIDAAAEKGEKAVLDVQLLIANLALVSAIAKSVKQCAKTRE